MAIVIGDLRAILGLDSSSFQQGLAQARSTLQGTGRTMRQIGQRMSVAVSAPLAGVGVLSLKTAADFEASMNRVRAASGASAEEMEKIEAAALKMGETTQFRASQAGDAIEVLAKNGLDASQILGGALDASMLLAASSGGELAASGDLATDVMLQFGKTAEEMTGLVDGMVGAMLESKFGFDDYRLAIAQAGGVAGGVGVEFEDFNAAIAGTSQLFASGSDAGTAFKTFLQRLVPASSPAAAAMKDLNLEFFNADGSMKSMAEVAQELQDGLSGLSEEARNDALSTIFGTDALRTAIGLADQGADGIERLKASIADASAEEQATARLEGYTGEMLKLQSALESLRIAIGNSGILEFATKLVQNLTDLVLSIKNANPELLKWGVIFGGLAAAMGPVLVAFGLLLQGLSPLIAVLKGVAIAAGAISAPFAIAAAAIGAAAWLAWENWDTVGPYFEELGRNLGSIFEGIAKVVIGVATGDLVKAVDGIKQAWGGLDGFFQTVFDGVAAAFEALPDRIRAPFQEIIDMLDKVDSMGRATEGFLARITGVGRGGPISSGGDTSPPGADVIAPPIPGEDVATGYSQGIRSGLGDAYSAGAELGAASGQGLRDEMGIQSPSRVMIEYGQYLSSGLAIGVDNDRGRVMDSMGRIGDGIVGVLENAALRGGSVMDGFREMIVSTLADIASSMFRSGLGGLFNGLIGAVDPLAGALRGAGLGAIPAFASGGSHGGGWRIVGENGPELEATGPARYFTAQQTRDMMSGGGTGQTRVEVIPSEYFDVRVTELADQSSARMGAQINRALPDRVKQINAKPRKR